MLPKVESFEPRSNPEISVVAAAAPAVGAAAEKIILLKEEEKPIISDKVNTLFPEAGKLFVEASDVRPKDELVIPNIDVLAKALDMGITPKELKVFYGGENKQLAERPYCLGLNDSSVKFADHPQSKECEALLKRSKKSIHIEKGNIFFDNKSSSESIYNFFLTQQDYSKRFLKNKIYFFCRL